jgi:hypothetical protein
MLERCYRPQHHKAHLYHARGIRVCAAWRRDFWRFVRDMGERPSPRHTLDRIDGSKGYRPGNVRWALPREQSRNRCDNIYVRWRGKRVLLVDLPRAPEVSYSLLKQRHVKHGWDLQRARSEPPRLYRKRR